MSEQDLVESELLKACRCLYVAVDEGVARHVESKAKACVAEIERLRGILNQMAGEELQGWTTISDTELNTLLSRVKGLEHELRMSDEAIISLKHANEQHRARLTECENDARQMSQHIDEEDEAWTKEHNELLDERDRLRARVKELEELEAVDIICRRCHARMDAHDIRLLRMSTLDMRDQQESNHD